MLTKSPLLLRDLDLFLELMEVTEFSACLSIPTLDEKAWRATEPHTPHPRKRLEAVAELNAAGIPTGVLVAPLMPGINDAPEQVEAVVAECEAAGATRDRRPGAVPARRDEGRVHGLAAARSGRTWCRCTSGCTARGAYLRAARTGRRPRRAARADARAGGRQELAERFQRGARCGAAGTAWRTRLQAAGAGNRR